MLKAECWKVKDDRWQLRAESLVWGTVMPVMVLQTIGCFKRASGAQPPQRKRCDIQIQCIFGKLPSEDSNKNFFQIIGWLIEDARNQWLS